jgi:macrolide-specific efflux system membrane fusion protein
LVTWHRREGELVAVDAPLAQIHDTDARLLVERTQHEAALAEKKMHNDVALKLAQKSLEVARAEHRRSLETNKTYPKTVSESELDRQRLLVERTELEVQQAEREQEFAALVFAAKDSERKLAEERLGRRTISAPVPGMLVEIRRRQGEWVQPGDTIARIVRLDRLRVEGLLPARLAQLSLVGAKVTVKATAAEEEIVANGTLVFVSPEIDPLNGQVRVWAEVANDELRLRAGMPVSVTITPPPSAATQP